MDGKGTVKLPDPGTQGRQLLELVAVSGDFPVYLLERLPGKPAYRASMVKKLKKKGLLRTFYRDGLRTLRLGWLAKELLMQESSERFAFFLTGTAETSRLKSEKTRRLRLARMADMYTAMQNAGVEIFRDQKPAVFSREFSGKERIRAPCYYGSREIKETGLDAVKIRSSRMTGMLLTEEKGYVVYNCGDALMKWGSREELRLKIFLQLEVNSRRLGGQYGTDGLEAVLFADRMETALLLMQAEKKDGAYFLFDGNYRHFYFLTNDYYGETLLRLLCCPGKKQEMEELMRTGLEEKTENKTGQDGYGQDGTPVLFGWFFDLPRIVRFQKLLAFQNRTGRIICFDFQREILERYFALKGTALEFETIDFRKFERRFFGD